MSEDVSATMRVGITVILVAALVATVLNLMVMSNSLLSGGQTTLQGGIDSVSQQEFASYDNTKVSGTQVATAISLFQGRDVAIVVQTKALSQSTKSYTSFVKDGVDYNASTKKKNNIAINYGALLTSDGTTSNGTVNMPTQLNGDTGANASGIITAVAKTAYLVSFSDGADGKSTAIVRNTGEPFYTGQLHNTNGLVDSSYDLIGTTELGNLAYLLSSARFSSVLIKDPTGSIIGIMFEQMN